MVTNSLSVMIRFTHNVCQTTLLSGTIGHLSIQLVLIPCDEVWQYGPQGLYIVVLWSIAKWQSSSYRLLSLGSQQGPLEIRELSRFCIYWFNLQLTIVTCLEGRAFWWLCCPHGFDRESVTHFTDTLFWMSRASNMMVFGVEDRILKGSRDFKIYSVHGILAIWAD